VGSAVEVLDWGSEQASSAAEIVGMLSTSREGNAIDSSSVVSTTAADDVEERALDNDQMSSSPPSSSEPHGVADSSDTQTSALSPERPSPPSDGGSGELPVPAVLTVRPCDSPESTIKPLSLVPVVYPCALSPEPDTARSLRSATPLSHPTPDGPGQAAKKLLGADVCDDEVRRDDGQTGEEADSGGLSPGTQSRGSNTSSPSLSDVHSAVSPMSPMDIPQGIDLEGLLSRGPEDVVNPLAFLAGSVDVQVKKKGRKSSSSSQSKTQRPRKVSTLEPRLLHSASCV